MIQKVQDTQEKRVLITGGNGHIASRLAQRFLQERDVRVMLWLHADTLEEFTAKRAQLEEQLSPAAGRVEYYCGDLASAKPFADVSPVGIHTVVHAAAVTRFNVEEDLAQRVNVEGSEKLMQFCTRIEGLQRLALLSTVYTAGLHAGKIEEAPLDDSAGFANFYESSKWTAESILQSRYADLPWQICRISTIIAEDEDGVVGQYNAVHNTLKLLFYGLLPIIPGIAETPLYFVTSKFVTDALFSLIHNAPVQRIYHVAHAREHAITLGDFMQTCYHTFSTDADFRRRRVIAPLYSDQLSFDRLADSVQGFGGAVMKQSVASVAPFSKQLFSDKDVQNEAMLTYQEQYRAPDMKKLVEKICLNLLLTRWNRQAA
ncbi:MAG TPA: SDR family oxidoreductase [Burkholderiaceae bacterium]|jgi:nucleoside-diphosphate-sugar epimerase